MNALNRKFLIHVVIQEKILYKKTLCDFKLVKLLKTKKQIIMDCYFKSDEIQNNRRNNKNSNKKN